MPVLQPEALAIAQTRLDRIARVHEVRSPSLWFDERAIAHNIDAMVMRVGDPARWRPHIKTHKSMEVVQLCLAKGVRHFKCATLAELSVVARAVALADVDVDVCCAYPFYAEQWRDALAMQRDVGRNRISWLVDSPAHFEHLTAGPENHVAGLKLALDVDTGMGRSGSTPEQWERFLSASPPSSWTGPHEIGMLHGYEGHLSWEQGAQADLGYAELLALHERVSGLGFDPEVLTSGTHSYGHALAHQGLCDLGLKAKVSPGTIVLNDLHSARAAQDLGLHFGAFVASRVIHASPGRITLDAGSKAIAPDVQRDLAYIVGEPQWRTQMQHEEHLVMVAKDASRRFEPGELIWLIPAHVCTTVNLYRHAYWFADPRTVSSVEIAQGHAWAQRSKQEWGAG